MSVKLSPVGNAFQFFTTTGLPLNQGLLYTYAAGTNTPLATYTTSLGNVQNNNPITLNTDGRLPNEVWLTEGLSYKFLLKDSLGNPIGTYDDLPGINDGTVSASIDMNGFILTDMGNGTAATDSVNLGQVQGGQSQTLTSVSGTNTIVATASPTPTLVVGSRFYFLPAVTNTSATTINISGLGAKNIFFNGAACVGNELLSGKAVEIWYDGTQFQIISAQAGNLPGTTQVLGGQLQFPAVDVPSSNVNTLDDYEEGTWTPSLGGSTTYTVQNGTYTKIGRLVFLFGSITVNIIGTGSNNTITGVPFAASVGGALPVITFGGVAASYVSIMPLITGSSILFKTLTAAAATPGTGAIFQNGAAMTFSGCYEV